MGINPLKASSSSQSENSEELTKGIQPLIDDSVYELYAPPNRGTPGVEVIFFHGLPLDHDDYTSSQAYWKTWLSRDGKVVWPKEWLPGSLTNPRILSVSYDAYARKHDGAEDDYTIAERLIQDLILVDDRDDRVIRVGQSCPVVLVGHSLGALIIKEFLLKCVTRRGPLFNSGFKVIDQAHVDNFLVNVKGVFYYSPPHNGSALIEHLQKKRIPLNGPLMKLLGILSSKTARINNEFANVRKHEVLKTQAIWESLTTSYMGFDGILVSEASARYDLDEASTAQRVNHFDVCKPNNNKSCGIFQKLVQFIRRAITETRPGIRPRVIEPVHPPEVSTSHPARPEGPSEMNTRPTEMDQDIQPLNDSVYELYYPQNGVLPGVIVIFFHGLPQENDYTKAYLKTWLARDNPETVWPKEWLPERLPSPRILSVSYNSCPVPEDGGASDSYVIAENLIQDIILHDKGLSEHDCPVILVGHGLGGIIIKELLLACSKNLGQLPNARNAQKLRNFLNNCKGVFYYATPHHGSEFIDNLAETVLSARFAGRREPWNNPLMELLSILNSKTERINEAFASGRQGRMRSHAIGESRDTTYMGYNGRLVEEASARYDIDELEFSTVYADHFDVCKPPDRTSNIFQHLVQFILTAIEIEPTQQIEEVDDMMLLV